MLLVRLTLKFQSEMRNKSKKRIYRYVKLLYYEQSSHLLASATIVAIFRQVGGYALYNTINLQICYALVGFFVMNH
jgi:hypothetical protein